MKFCAKEIMSYPVVTVNPGTSLGELARMFAEDGISGAPVVDFSGRLLGIVSKTDVVRRIAEGGLSPDTVGWFYSTHGYDWGTLDNKITVEQIMEEEVVTVEPTAPIEEISSRMAEGKIHRVVVAEKGNVLGMITSLDLLGYWPKKK